MESDSSIVNPFRFRVLAAMKLDQVYTRLRHNEFHRHDYNPMATAAESNLNGTGDAGLHAIDGGD